MKLFNKTISELLILVSFTMYSCTSSPSIKTTDEAVKFLESHTWKGTDVCYTVRGRQSSSDSYNGEFEFKNGKVLYSDEESSYTISQNKYPNNDLYYTLTFHNSKISPDSPTAIEIFTLYQKGTAHCNPAEGNDGVFADFDNSN